MATTKPTSSHNPKLKRWVTPVVGLAIGVAYLIAGLMSGNPAGGIQGFAIMALVVVGMVLASRRSETVRGLLDHQDERIATIDLKATAFAGVSSSLRSSSPLWSSLLEAKTAPRTAGWAH